MKNWNFTLKLVAGMMLNFYGAGFVATKLAEGASQVLSPTALLVSQLIAYAVGLFLTSSVLVAVGKGEIKH
jgi:hypothetical protein